MLPLQNSSAMTDDGSNLQESFQRLYESGELTDFSFVVEDEDGREELRIRVHGAYLATRSDVFKAMLTNNLTEKSSSVCIVKNIDADVLKCLVYGIPVQLEGEEVEHFKMAMRLFAAADKYMISALRPRCLDVLSENISCPDNKNLAVDVYLLAKKYSLDFVRQSVVMVVATFLPDYVAEKHLRDVVESQLLKDSARLTTDRTEHTTGFSVDEILVLDGEPFCSGALYMANIYWCASVVRDNGKIGLFLRCFRYPTDDCETERRYYVSYKIRVLKDGRIMKQQTLCHLFTLRREQISDEWGMSEFFHDNLLKSGDGYLEDDGSLRLQVVFLPLSKEPE